MKETILSILYVHIKLIFHHGTTPRHLPKYFTTSFTTWCARVLQNSPWHCGMLTTHNFPRARDARVR